jgi:hypothetical protein
MSNFLIIHKRKIGKQNFNKKTTLSIIGPKLEIGPAQNRKIVLPVVGASSRPGRKLGYSHTVVRASAYVLDDSYLSRCEDDTLIICQVETAAGIAEVEFIAAVDGVDVVQMGPLDLSASMGYLWDPGNRKVRATLREAERKVLEGRKKVAGLDGNAAYLGGFALPNDPAELLKLRGYHMVAGAVDVLDCSGRQHWMRSSGSGR